MDRESNSGTQQNSQQINKEEGERGDVEQAQSSDVLQIEQQVDLSTADLDPNISQQEAFQQKYQPVEILNSEGEWVSGYWVHKCIVVGNLEGVERKYALVDEMGGKYAFWGEIRLPRVR